MRNRLKYLLSIASLALILTGCTKSTDLEVDKSATIETITESEIEEESLVETEMDLPESTEPTEETVDISEEETTECESTTEEDIKCVVLEETVVLPNDHLIVIDPGHQQKGNSEKEPVGPGATQK